MKRDYGGVGTIALRASSLLQAMSRDIEEQRKEFNLTEYHQTYTRNAVAKLPKLMGDKDSSSREKTASPKSGRTQLLLQGVAEESPKL